MKKRKKIVILLCIILVVFICANIMLNLYADKVDNIPVSNPDIEHISDGTYIGEYSATPVYVKVKVSIANHKITDIRILEHRNGLGSKAEKVVDDVMNTQSLDVDAVSGATVSSKCIIKAIENALQNERK